MISEFSLIKGDYDMTAEENVYSESHILQKGYLEGLCWRRVE